MAEMIEIALVVASDEVDVDSWFVETFWSPLVPKTLGGTIQELTKAVGGIVEARLVPYCPRIAAGLDHDGRKDKIGVEVVLCGSRANF